MGLYDNSNIWYDVNVFQSTVFLFWNPHCHNSLLIPHKHPDNGYYGKYLIKSRHTSWINKKGISNRRSFWGLCLSSFYNFVWFFGV